MGHKIGLFTDIDFAKAFKEALQNILDDKEFVSIDKYSYKCKCGIDRRDCDCHKE